MSTPDAGNADTDSAVAPLLRRDTDFNGWGAPGSRPVLGEGIRALLADRLGPLVPSATTPLADVQLPDAADLPPVLVAAAGGDGAISVASEDRIRHSAGKSYPDLIRMRSGELTEAPDAVLAPASPESVAAVLAACAGEGIAVVPFGGGTSVVGGVEPAHGPFERLVSLDLGAKRDVGVDPVSQTARLGPGLRGPEAERALNAEGFTLGHFPQSYRYATIGGFAATRSAGQASSGYGRFDALVTEIELTAPRGRMRTLTTPHTAAGPSLRELVLGSEGIFGVITDVGVRVRPEPMTRHYEAWFAPGFAEGAEIVRSLAQEDQVPDVVRLSDRDETEVSLAMAGLQGVRRAGLERYLKLRRRESGCMLIAGWEGERESAGRRGEEIEQWRPIKAAACEAIVAAGGTITHHHAVGQDHAPYMRAEVGGLGIDVLRAVKDQLDPVGVMNPGKLIRF